MTDHIPELKVQHWPHQSSTAEMIAFYGDPRPSHGGGAWAAAHLVQVTPPWKMVFTDDNGNETPVAHFSFNKAAAESLKRVLNAIWEGRGKNQQSIDDDGLNQFGGAFNYRTIRGSSHISNHAFGCAIDIDPGDFPLGSNEYMPDDVVAAFKAEGWRYGGDYHGRKDPMHFEAVR